LNDLLNDHKAKMTEIFNHQVITVEAN